MLPVVDWIYTNAIKLCEYLAEKSAACACGEYFYMHFAKWPVKPMLSSSHCKAGKPLCSSKVFALQVPSEGCYAVTEVLGH